MHIRQNNLRLFDDINAFAEERQEIEALFEKSRKYLFKVSNGNTCC